MNLSSCGKLHKLSKCLRKSYVKCVANKSNASFFLQYRSKSSSFHSCQWTSWWSRMINKMQNKHILIREYSTKLRNTTNSVVFHTFNRSANQRNLNTSQMNLPRYSKMILCAFNRRRAEKRAKLDEKQKCYPIFCIANVCINSVWEFISQQINADNVQRATKKTNGKRVKQRKTHLSTILQVRAINTNYLAVQNVCRAIDNAVVFTIGIGYSSTL